MSHLSLSIRAFTAFISIGTIAAGAGTHPLDPLDFKEYWTALEVLHSADKLDEQTRFSQLSLREPAKRDVLRWRPGDAIPRLAYALVHQGREAFEAVVDLRARKLVSWDALKDVQPNWLGEEFGKVVGEVLKHPDFVAGLKKRGIADTLFLDCFTIPPGYYGTEEERGRRIGHVRCQDVRGVRNTWMREVEGLTAVVDLDKETVLRVVDEGATPPAPTEAEYHREPGDAIREIPGPLRVSQPLGPGFEIDRYQVAWQNWRFHVRPDQRAGMVLSLVYYVEADDSVRERSVLYEGHLSEIFVPYMDPSFAWYQRNFIDSGEFSAVGLTEPLLPGRDCPDHAVYFDHVRPAGNGRPYTTPRTICLFEREIGDPAWRHGAGKPESRASRDLVVRSAMVIGNYDYLLDWIFRQDGSIRIAVGATGILEVKAAVAEDADDQSDADADAYGHFLDRRVVGVNHDHYFSFRLDLDVDGAKNSFVADRLTTETLPEAHPRRSIWVKQAQVAKREDEAKLDIDMHSPALWRVVSVDAKNHVGYPTSYQLVPGRNARTLLTADDYPRRRAGFIDHHLWVTPHRERERWAAGDHPTLSEPGMGLPDWTSANRRLRNRDIVLWHTIGMHHPPRSEDWPVMPVMWHGFDLRPFDFFDRNPAMDLP